jgi:hypothetical protein
MRFVRFDSGRCDARSHSDSLLWAAPHSPRGICENQSHTLTRFTPRMCNLHQYYGISRPHPRVCLPAAARALWRFIFFFRCAAGCARGRVQTSSMPPDARTMSMLAVLLEAFRVNAEHSKCRRVPVDNSTSAKSSGFSVGERYADLVKCGNLSLLITRLQPNMKEFEWITLVRGWSNDRASQPGRLVPRSWHMSHNAATVCVNSTLHVFGGQYRNYTVSRGATARGIFHAQASTHALRPGVALHWGAKDLQIEGYTGGCIEKRNKFAGYCEFDGSLSAVYYRNRFFIYARANLAAAGGARHVQVTSASYGLGSWSEFQLVHLPGVKAGRPDANIYFFNVQVYGDQLLALFPAVFPGIGNSGVYVSTSMDGVEWARPQLLLATTAFCARTRIHPVRLSGDFLYLMSNIDLSEPMDIPEGRMHQRGATRPYLQRIRVTRAPGLQLLGVEHVSATAVFQADTLVSDIGTIESVGSVAALGRFHVPAQ